MVSALDHDQRAVNGSSKQCGLLRHSNAEALTSRRAPQMPQKHRPAHRRQHWQPRYAPPPVSPRRAPARQQAVPTATALSPAAVATPNCLPRVCLLRAMRLSPLLMPCWHQSLLGSRTGRRVSPSFVARPAGCSSRTRPLGLHLGLSLTTAKTQDLP